jgi:predicted amidohydrolase
LTNPATEANPNLAIIFARFGLMIRPRYKYIHLQKSTMENIKIASAQFEHKNGDKNYNLTRMAQLTAAAAAQGAQVIAFHECAVTGLTHAMDLSKEAMLELAEFIPAGPSIGRLQEIAATHQVAILAGLFEKDEQDKLYKAYVCVDQYGLVAKFRKLHPFINPHLTAGTEYCVFDLYGWKCGILICYDNNIVENVRATHLLGADILFMPHVTMCTPSSRPGAGFVDPQLWHNREADPTSLRIEFDSLKGRSWLMKWLPARAYDNGMYVVFANAIGMDAGQLKNGCSMILDPFGDILSECRHLGDDIAVAVCTPSKLTLAGGYRYKNARRPELYGHILGKAHASKQVVAWKNPEA